MRFRKTLAAVLAIVFFAFSVPVIAETSPYYITVDIVNQVVTVYKTEDRSESGIVRQMICSTGMGSATPVGVFTMSKKIYSAERTEWYYFADFSLWAKYVSRIQGPYMFHSILFSTNTSQTPTWGSSHSLGSKASHGCVRLRVDDAKWIAENCFAGTVIYIFDDGTRDSNLRKLLLDRTFSADTESYADFRRGLATVGRGSEANLVKLVQEKLNEAGFDCGTADGKFGNNTETAVKAWQEANGFEPIGTLDFNELRALTRLLDVDLEGMLPSIPAQDARMFDIKAGIDFDGVTLLQQQLNALGYASLKANGNFGESTQEAVAAYQKANGMEETGELTYAEYEAVLALPTPTPAPTPTPCWQTGSRSDEVRQLQEKLCRLGYLAGKADGIFGEATRQAVLDWQADSGWEADGVVSYDQMNVLLALPDPTPAAGEN